MQTEMRTTGGENAEPAPPPKDAWGWLPVQSVMVALGILLVSVACSMSRASMPWSMEVFWIGYLTILALPTIRLTMKGVSRQERLSTILLIGIAFYLIKVFYSPLVFNFNDELQHWASTYNTLRGQSLFEYNPTLPVSSYFPGLESAANAFISLSSVSIFESGIVIEGAARFLTLISLFVLFERVSQSSYVAGIAGLIYLADPNFMLGDSQFTYEGLAISMTVTGLYFALRRVQMDESRSRMGLIIVAILCFASVIITHHVTSYILAILVSIWGIVSLLARKLPEWKFGPAWFALMIVSGCVAWLALVSPIVIPYISVPVQNGFTQAMQVIMGEQAPRAFLQGNSGNQMPLPLRISIYLSVLLLAGMLPIGAWRLWHQKTQNSLAPAMTAMALGYYIAQLLRLSPLGLGLTNRLAGAVFLPLSFVVAIGFIKFFNQRYFKSSKTFFMVVYLLVVNIGSAAAIINARPLPGPYNVDIFSRRISTEGLEVASWAANVLGPEHRFGADYINMLLLGSYGRQHLVGELSDEIFIEQSIYSTSEFGTAEKGVLRKGGVDYLVLDTRIEQDKQVVGPLRPNSKAFQTNLDGLETVDRIFDSGNIMIFRMGFVTQPLPDELPTLQLDQVNK